MWYLLYEILFIISLFTILSTVVRQVQRYQFMNKYKIILSLLDHFLKTSYQVIYNDQIIAYTSQGLTNIQKDQLETIERNFIKLTIDIMGPRNKQLLIDFLGGQEVLIKNIVLYFRQRLERDEITKAIQSRMKI